jgi:hypothetical protein
MKTFYCGDIVTFSDRSDEDPSQTEYMFVHEENTNGTVSGYFVNGSQWEAPVESIRGITQKEAGYFWACQQLR